MAKLKKKKGTNRRKTNHKKVLLKVGGLIGILVFTLDRAARDRGRDERVP